MFKSFSELKKTLGQYDAAVELKELSLRFLNSQFNQNNKIEFISSISKKVNIAYNPASYDESKRLICLSYISMAYSGFDNFVYSLNSEIETIFGKKNINTDGLCELDILIEKMKQITNKTINPIKNIVEYDIVQYYRLIRNEFVHPFINKHENIDYFYKRIDKNKLNKAYPKYSSCLNTKNNISFDDFIFLSLIIKEYAKILCDFIEPSDDIMAKSVDYKKFVRYGLNSERFINSITQHLVSNFSIRLDKAKKIACLVKQMALESER
jgi:hypothetical protein